MLRSRVSLEAKTAGRSPKLLPVHYLRFEVTCGRLKIAFAKFASHVVMIRYVTPQALR